MNCVVTVDIRAVGYRVPLYQILTRGRQKEAMTAVGAQVGGWAGGRATQVMNGCAYWRGWSAALLIVRKKAWS